MAAGFCCCIGSSLSKRATRRAIWSGEIFTVFMV